MTDNIIDILKAELQKLRSEADISYSAMEASINRIKEAIAKGTCAWEDLGITEEEFALLELQCFNHQIGSVVRAHTMARNRVKSLLHDFKGGAFDNNLAKARSVVDIIRNAVAMSLITWDEIGTTKEELDRLLKKITP